MAIRQFEHNSSAALNCASFPPKQTGRQATAVRAWHPSANNRHPSPATAIKRQARWRWHALLLCLLLVQPLLARAEAPVPDSVQSGSLLLRMASGYHVATALDTDVDMTINGLVARVKVRQEFTNEGSEWAEGIYVFPLPDTAAVDQMRLHIGERFIEGEIREKEQARKEYEDAKAAGKKTSLVEQQRPNLFTTSVANIAPGETVVVEIEYLENLVYADGLFGLRFPMTLTPRYMPGQPTGDRTGNGWSANTSEVPDASAISPPMVDTSQNHKVTMNVRLNAGLPLELIASRYHPVTVTEEQNRYRITLRNDNVPLDHDFELTWKPVPSQEPQAMTFTETIDGEAHYLLMVMPPDNTVRMSIPREMIFIVDTSGSMHGTSIAQAKRALQRALNGLRPGDRFNIIAFSSTPRPLFGNSQPADAANLQLANDFVARLTADGGTEMRSALELAMRHPATEAHLRQVIFITDGAVGNEEALFSLIGERLGSGRLFTIGIGSAPNSWFMRKAAEAGRGTFTFISALNEVSEKMDRLFAKIEQPQLTNIDVAWPAGVTVETYPGVVPDLYIGEPVSIRAKITGPLLESDVVRISGDSAAGAWHSELALHADEIDSPSPGVAALWARARIESLFDEARRGRDVDEVRAAVIETALQHNLVSKYTSLVAVDKTPVRAAGDALRKDVVPNRMAWGQSGAAIFGFPATATNAGQLRLTGVACLLVALALLLVGRRREARHVSLA